MDALGDFAIAWQSKASGHWGINAQRYDALGFADGGEVQVSPTATVDQQYPAVAMDDAGDLLVTWTNQPYLHNTFVLAQQYTATGAALGGPFAVNTSQQYNDTDASVAMNDQGNVVSVWAGGDAADKDGVLMQQYSISFSGESSDGFYADGDPNDPDQGHGPGPVTPGDPGQGARPAPRTSPPPRSSQSSGRVPGARLRPGVREAGRHADEREGPVRRDPDPLFDGLPPLPAPVVGAGPGSAWGTATCGPGQAEAGPNGGYLFLRVASSAGGPGVRTVPAVGGGVPRPIPPAHAPPAPRRTAQPPQDRGEPWPAPVPFTPEPGTQP